MVQTPVQTPVTVSPTVARRVPNQVNPPVPWKRSCFASRRGGPLASRIRLQLRECNPALSSCTHGTKPRPGNDPFRDHAKKEVETDARSPVEGRKPHGRTQIVSDEVGGPWIE